MDMKEEQEYIAEDQQRPQAIGLMYPSNYGYGVSPVLYQDSSVYVIDGEEVY